MSHTLLTLLSYSIFVAACAAVARIGKLRRVFMPFVLLILLGSINEIISTLVISKGGHTSSNNNIYMLLEALLLCWQFRRWGIFSRLPWLFWSFFASLLTLWVLEIRSIGLQADIIYFSMYYCLLLAAFSVITISRLAAGSDLLAWERNSTFQFCITFIVYFIFRLLLDSSWYFGINMSADFQHAVFSIMAIINFLTNMAYAMAILWIPGKRRYSESL